MDKYLKYFIFKIEMRDIMETLKLNARVDANAKNEQFCNSVGNNVSTVVNKAVLREQKLPFDGEVYEKLKEAELEMSNT